MDILLQPGVEVITDPAKDLENVDVSNATLIAFDNVTDTDMFIKFRVNGVEQSTLVFAGKSTVLRYRCPERIRLMAEFDFSGPNGDFDSAWDLSSIGLVNEGAVFMMPPPPSNPTMMDDQNAQDDPNFADPNDSDFDADPNEFDFEDPNSFEGDPNFFGFDGEDFDELNPDDFDGEGLLPGEHFDGVKPLAGGVNSFVCGQLIVFEMGDMEVRVKDRVSLEEVK